MLAVRNHISYRTSATQTRETYAIQFIQKLNRVDGEPSRQSVLPEKFWPTAEHLPTFVCSTCCHDGTHIGKTEPTATAQHNKHGRISMVGRVEAPKGKTCSTIRVPLRVSAPKPNKGGCENEASSGVVAFSWIWCPGAAN
jgi:hypothetical protein